jgi:hypothetical protein
LPFTWTAGACPEPAVFGADEEEEEEVEVPVPGSEEEPPDDVVAGSDGADVEVPEVGSMPGALVWVAPEVAPDVVPEEGCLPRGAVPAVQVPGRDPCPV